MSDIKKRIITGTVVVALLWVGLEYYRIALAILVSALMLAFKEYSIIFNRIISSQTGKEEEGYIKVLGSSLVPYVSVLSFVISAAKSDQKNAETYLCLNLVLCVVLVSLSRITQYSNFCSQVSGIKKKQMKSAKPEEKVENE